MLESFPGLRKFSGAPIPSWQLTRKYGFTTKRTEDTKGSDIYTLKLRALLDLRGEMSIPTLVAA